MSNRRPGADRGHGRGYRRRGWYIAVSVQLGHETGDLPVTDTHPGAKHICHEQSLPVECAGPGLGQRGGLYWACDGSLVLSLGIGMAVAAGQASSLSGFGIVTLASLFPIIGVLSLAIFIYFTLPAEEIIA